MTVPNLPNIREQQTDLPKKFREQWEKTGFIVWETIINQSYYQYHIRFDQMPTISEVEQAIQYDTPYVRQYITDISGQHQKSWIDTRQIVLTHEENGYNLHWEVNMENLNRAGLITDDQLLSEEFDNTFCPTQSMLDQYMETEPDYKVQMHGEEYYV